MFYLIKNYQDILLFASLLLLLYGALRVLGKRSLGLIKTSLLEYRPFQGKTALTLLILLVLVVNCFMVPLEAQQKAKAEISLNYAKASQGLNPNGTRYNQSGILSREILEDTVQRGAFSDITAQDLMRTMSVAPKVQGNSRSESTYFISTQFVLSYRANKDTMHLNGETLVSLAADTYKNWFRQTYSENIDALRQDFDKIKEEDYLDICEYLRKRGDLINNYMTRMANEAPSFQSSLEGETFQSIASQASNAANVMVEKLEAYLLENGVSKETEFYRSRLGFQNVFSYFNARKAARSNQNNLAAISMYEDDMARIVLVPTYDVNYQFYMSQTRIGVDDFAKVAESQANDKTQIHSTMARNNHILQQLSLPSQINGIDKKAEMLVLQIEEELNRLSDKAQTMVEEYCDSQMNEYITITVESLEDQIFSILLKIFLLTLVFAVSVHCVAFAATVVKKPKKTEKKPEGKAGGEAMN